MPNTRSQNAILPQDFERATLVGRLWQPGLGATLVQIRPEGVFDVSGVAPTCARTAVRELWCGTQETGCGSRAGARTQGTRLVAQLWVHIRELHLVRLAEVGLHHVQKAGIVTRVHTGVAHNQRPRVAQAVGNGAAGVLHCRVAGVARKKR